jgi:ABC-type phosphate transport system permease subunit
MPDLYARRRHRNTIVLVLSVGATVIGLGWLVMILGTLVYEGFSGLSLAVFTEMTPPPGAAGGLLNPIVGSLMLTCSRSSSARPSACWPAPTWPNTASMPSFPWWSASSTTSC